MNALAKKNILALTIAQSFAMTSPAIIVLLGGIVGNTLAPEPALSTLPVTAMIIGGATFTVPAALIMKKTGRKSGFIFAAICAAFAGILAAYAINESLFNLFCIATFISGAHMAFIQQYRFAAAESVTLEKTGKAVSFLMSAGIVAAFIGPELADRLSIWPDLKPYTGSFLGMAALMLMAALSLFFYENTQHNHNNKNSNQTTRSVLLIIRQPLFILSLTASCAAFGVMSLIMTVTPISMHLSDHFSVTDTSRVIQAHIIAMYLPSLFSAFFISKFGYRNMMLIGVTAMLLCLILSLHDNSFMHYWLALVLLGIGWNFLFIAGTTALSYTHSTSEKFSAQAVNDGVVFSLQAIAALSSGAIMKFWGWQAIQWISFPLLLTLLILIFYQKSTQHSPP